MFVVLSCIKFGSMKVKGCLNLMLLFFFNRNTKVVLDLWPFSG